MTEKTTEISNKKSSRKRRIAAFVIDHFFMTFLMVSMQFLIVGPDFIDQDNPSSLMTTMIMVMIPGFLLYFSKDSFNGISLGKWIMGIMIRDENNESEIPSFGRLFLRNLFIIIWPIEFIVLATNKDKKRLGDKIAKTIVVENKNKSKKIYRILALVGLIVSFYAFTFAFVGNSIQNSEAYLVAVAEIGKNEEILTETGGIVNFETIPSGNINISDEVSQAQFKIKVLGNKKDINVSVFLERDTNGQWKIIEMQK